MIKIDYNDKTAISQVAEEKLSGLLGKSDIIKILLISPYKNEPLRVGQYLAPPIGIYRIKSYLKKKIACDVDVYDPNLDSIEGLENLVAKKRYDIIGFSVLHPTLKNDMLLMDKLRLLSPGPLFVAGGQGAAFNHALLLKKPHIDLIIRGFGELPMLEISKRLSSKGSLIERFGDIPGLIFLYDKKLFFTKSPLKCSNDDFKEISMSFDFKDVLFEKYWEYMEQVYQEKDLFMMKNDGMLRTIRLMTSSHCPKGCSICSSTNFLNFEGKPVSPLMLDYEEILILIEKALEFHPQTTSIYFCDDDFIQDKKRVIGLCNKIQFSEKLKKINFSCLTRVDRLDDELLLSLKSANFKFIILGVESFSSKIIHDMNKSYKEQDYRKIAKQNISKMLDIGICPLMNLILFYPTSSIEDIKQTIEHSINLVEIGARLTVYSYVEAYSGSKIVDEMKGNVKYVPENINGETYEFPLIIEPEQKEVRVLAAKALELRKELLEFYKNKYRYGETVPHPLFGLSLFISVYKILGIDSTRIENLVDKILCQEETDTLRGEANDSKVRI